MVTIFHQSATGHFTCRGVPNTPHCGPNCRVCELDYQVNIDWRLDPLDPNGFLLDNTWFASFFACMENCRVSISCEQLAALFAHQIFGVTATRAKSVTVALAAVPGVWIRATSSAGE
jgi:hypothetical protein